MHGAGGMRRTLGRTIRQLTVAYVCSGGNPAMSDLAYTPGGKPGGFTGRGNEVSRIADSTAFNKQLFSALWALPGVIAEFWEDALLEKS